MTSTGIQNVWETNE